MNAFQRGAQYMNGFFKITTALALLSAAAPALAAAEDEAVALEVAAAGLAPNKFVWSGAAEVMSNEPVTVVVSIPLQRAFVFRGRTMIAASAVSTGADDKPTPTGVFPILQKAVKHTSNLYGSSMPYMQRLTWDGVALHAGANPGFPASHGCVRLPAAFAKRLFEVTAKGSNVVITDQAFVDSTLDPELLRDDAARANDAQLAALTASAAEPEAGN